MLKLVGAIVVGVLLASLSVLVLSEKKQDPNDLVKFVENQNKINATNLELHQQYGARLGELEDQLRYRDKLNDTRDTIVKDLQNVVNRIITQLEKVIKDVNENLEFIRNVLNDHEHRLANRNKESVPPVGFPKGK